MNAVTEDVLLYRFKELGAIKFAKPGKPFILKSGRESNYYLDCRLLSLDAVGAECLGESFVNSISEHLDDNEDDRVYVGSSGVGGAPLVGATLSHAGYMELPWQGFVVREFTKDHGMQNRIEGHYGMDGPIVLIEDVITTAGSVIAIVNALEEKGFRPTSVHCIVDRNEGGKEALAKLGLPLYSLFALEDLLKLETKK